MTDSTDIFVEVLSEKTFSQYVFRNFRINGSIIRVENRVLYSYDTLVPQPVYILKLQVGKTVAFKKIKRSVLLKKLPGEYRSIVKKIIQESNLSIRYEKDLIKLVELIN